jgi:glutaryl-CoA transferase
MSGPLDDLKVLDLSRILAGPWASQLLADYGADVIKVERPGEGDDTRSWGPPWLATADGEETGESAYFLATNRNKKSITVNIADPAGQALIRKLAAGSDVLIENYRVGALARFGLDAASLREACPRLIYCSISAYGQHGPRAHEPGYDAMIQASAGLMSLTGEADGMPQKTGVAIADIMTGMYAVSAILAAVHARAQTGRGQHIDVPLFDSQLAWLANQSMNYLVSGKVPERHGNAHPNIVPYQSFATRDGYLMLAVGNDRQFRACADCLGRPELADDERYTSNAARVRHRAQLIPELAKCFAAGTTENWLQRLTAAGIPCGPINDLAAAFADPQVAARELLVKLPHSLAGTVPAVANPVRFADTPAELRHAAPLLGEHTDEVLQQVLGCSDDEIAGLRANGTI